MAVAVIPAPRTRLAPPKADRDFVLEAEARDVVGLFPAGGPGERLGRRFADAYLASAPSKREGVGLMARDAAAFANNAFYANHARRDGDMSEWFGLDSRDVADVAAAGAAARERWDARPASEADAEEADRIAELAEEEDERVSALEEDGWYGRTHRYGPECESWIFVRFGRMPKSGRSNFGLAGEDTEDGPDEWRAEMGNKSSESGVCVLRAYRHPSVPDAYLLAQPDFGLALYGVSGGFDRYLLDVCPRFEEGQAPVVLRVDGSPVTCLGRDGTLRLELGSDGEYMVDASKPMTVHELGLGDVWISPSTRMDDFLKERRGPEWGHDAPSGP